jgi:hypothetical protein
MPRITIKTVLQWPTKLGLGWTECKCILFTEFNKIRCLEIEIFHCANSVSDNSGLSLHKLQMGKNTAVPQETACVLCLRPHCTLKDIQAVVTWHIVFLYTVCTVCKFASKVAI